MRIAILTATVAGAIIWLFSGDVLAKGFNDPIQVTTHPGEDFAGSVLPDKNILIFVSDQSGNLDLWLKHFGPGVHPPARQLTFHTAEDNSPAISPEGRHVVFVSHRTDPKGDLYLLELDSVHSKETPPKLRKLTDAAFADKDPTWSPDGRFIYFTSKDSGAEKESVFKLDLDSGKRTRVLKNDGLNPAVSPDGRYLAYVTVEPDSALWVLDLDQGRSTRISSHSNIDASPRWSTDGSWIFFTRYHDDTNFDGQISIEDNPNIWSVEFLSGSPGNFRQLTSSDSYDLLPAPAGKDHFVFTSSRKNSVDIWTLPRQGVWSNGFNNLEFVKEVPNLCSEYSPSYQCLLLYNNLILSLKDKKEIASLRYLQARQYLKMGHRREARRVFSEIAEKHPDNEDYLGLAEIDLILLDVNESGGSDTEAFREKARQGLQKLDTLAARFSGHPRVLARSALERGNLYFFLNKPDQALEFYKKVIHSFSDHRDFAAEAAFNKSRVYSLVGDRERLIDSYVQVVRDFHDVTPWSQNAIREILKLFEDQPLLNKKVASLQGLIAKYGEPRRLAAAVQNRIGELYYQSHENLLSKEAYWKTIRDYPDVSEAKYGALFALAEIYAEEENFEKSLEVLQQISAESEGLEKRIDQARNGYIRKSLQKGTWEMRVGEVKLAYKTFLRLIEFSPENVEAHRGYVEASAALEQVPGAVTFYQSRVQKNKQSAVDRYALGLAFTYLNPPDLASAQSQIAQAIAINSQQVYFHQTLGWIYEQNEILKQGEGYLEQAVNEYQIALALNDEVKNPGNEANLLLNLGNGHFLLNNFDAAHYFYGKREAAAIPFFDANREAIYYQRYGESAFKAGFPSIPHFKRALEIFSEKNDLPRMAELNDRIALACQDAGDHARAVEYYTRALELNRKTGNTVSLSRGLRNIANNLFELSRSGQARDPAALNQALTLYFQAIEHLENYGLIRKERRKTALVDIEIETGLDADTSTAARGFDKAGEEKLIFHYIGKIYGDFGKYDKAVEYYKKKLELIPDNLDPEKNIPVLLEKALLQNQIGNFYYKSGNYAESLKFFQKSYALSSRLGNRHGMAVNAANIGKVVLVRCGTLPFDSLRDEITSTALQLEEASLRIGRIEAIGGQEYDILIKNHLGILHHYLAYHETVPRVPGRKPPGLSAELASALEDLNREVGHARKSIKHFESALSLLGKNEDLRKTMEPALKQNLRYARFLAGQNEETPEIKYSDSTLPVNLLWQFKYVQALTADPGSRLDLLLESEQLLDRLPYGTVPVNGSTLAFIEDLYTDISSKLFEQKKYGEALIFSEKGRQRLLISIRPRVEFSREDRRAYQEELLSYGNSLESALPEEAGVVVEEYGEFLSMVKEDDPQLAALFAPGVPLLEEIQSLLHPGELLVKFQIARNRILLWFVTGDRIRGRIIEGTGSLFKVIDRIARTEDQVEGGDLSLLSKQLLGPLEKEFEEADSLLLIADGPMEFLPWAAMQFNGKILIETFPVTFLTSLEQFRAAELKKNLYNSRYLSVERSDMEMVEPFFVSAAGLSGNEATLKRFQLEWNHYGVIEINSPVYMRRFDASSSYIGLTRNQNRFEQMSLEELYMEPVISNFIYLSDLQYEFHPATTLSPTMPLVEALTWKGFPGILMYTGSPDARMLEEFSKRFYAEFRKGNPSETLRRVQVELARQFPGSLAWADFRFYGFPGMSEEEKVSFAEAHFRANAEKGARAFAEKDWLGAIDFLERSMLLLDFMPDKEFSAKINKTLAQAAYNHGDYRKAIGYQRKVHALALKSDDPEESASAEYFLGILYSRAEDYEKAVEHLRQALAIYEEYEILDRLAESYSTLGIVEENALDYDGALEAFSASLRINEEIGEDLNRGLELRRIGRIYYLRLNQYQQAINYFSRARELFQELGETEQVVESLLELGLVSEKQGNFDEAVKYYQQAQTLAEEADLKTGVSKALLYQANSNWFQGNYQNAFRYQKAALEISQTTNDKLQQVFIYNTRGLIFWTLNDSTRALANLNKSLELAKEVNSPLDIASAYNNIGLVHRKDKRYEQSIVFFKKALEKDVELKSKWGQGYTHRNLGMSYLRLGQLDEAEPQIKRSIGLSREIGNTTNLVKAMLESGHLALARNNCERAISVFRDTAELAGQLNIREVQWRALRGWGYCLVQTGQREEAAQVYKQSVSVVDGMRAAIKVEEFQNGFLEDKQDVYKELVLLLLDLGRVKESFEYTERAKSRSFIDLLGNQKVSLKNDVSQKLYDSLTRQKINIRTIEEALGTARSKKEEEETRRLAADLVSARNTYQELLIEAKEASPEISSFVTVESISLEQLYGLLDETVAVLEFLVTKEELVTWVIFNGQIRVVRTPLKETELNALIKDYRNRIQQLAPVEAQSVQLYNWLIRPVESLLASRRVVGIVPHGHLHYVSFASLFDSESYFVEKHPLFYSPSASVLQYTFKRKIPVDETVKVLAIGNPDLGDFNYDLPLSEMEANAIRWEFPQIDVLTRGQATESWLYEHIGEYRIIHIGSHGEFDPVNPLFSSLKLSRDDQEDGNFEVNEVFSLDVRADLVTLSACQTGLGEIVGGDELVGLNRAFIYAGTHAILSSLWRVSDISTAVLIKHFYRNYLENNKAESLRKAQLLVKRLYPHPSYWAGFNLTGDYR